MVWLQAAVCFALWVGYGVIQGRRTLVVRAWALAIPRTRRGLMAAAMMLGAMVPVFVVLNLGLHYNGFGTNGMTPVVWIGVALFGLLFVHGQTLATALLVTMATESVTVAGFEASSTQTTRKYEDHEENPS